jgi:hypothetical protein
VITCPTCKGNTTVDVGTKFTKAYRIADWLKPPVNQSPPGGFYVPDASYRAQSGGSGSRRDDTPADDGPGIGTFVIAAAIISNSSNDGE